MIHYTPKVAYTDPAVARRTANVIKPIKNAKRRLLVATGNRMTVANPWIVFDVMNGQHVTA